jgi:hypothetical protein
MKAKDTMKTHPLPKKLSDLILVALGDLEKAERSKNYIVDMHTFHIPPRRGCSCFNCSTGRCAVCFAGSVMAFSLNAPINEELMPHNFRQDRHALLALDGIRCGWLPSGERFEVTSYATDPEQFKTEMVLTAAALREAGL